MINFSTSGFVKNNEVVTCTSSITMILGQSDIQLLNLQGKLLNPKSKASFYFNFSDAWVPIFLHRIELIKGLENFVEGNYVILFFKSDFPLPQKRKERSVILSPMGALSVSLYLNQTHRIVVCSQLNYRTKLVKFSSSSAQKEHTVVEISCFPLYIRAIH